MSLVIVMGLALVAVAVGIGFAYSYLRGLRSALPPEVAVRRQALRQRLNNIIARVPVTPRLRSREVPAHPQAASIETKLLIGTIQSALDEAEELLIETPGDVRVHVLLARVLIHNGDLRAAAGPIARARLLGATGSMIEYLEGRARQLHLQRRVQLKESADENTAEWDAELITPFELFVLQAERRRSHKLAAMWLASSELEADKTMEHDELVTLVTEHFSAYYDCLDKLARAAEREPGFSDALYHAARISLKVGFIDEGLTLMEKIAPLMVGSPEKRFYEHDLKLLHTDGPWNRAMHTAKIRGALSAAMQAPPLDAEPKRSSRLKLRN